MYQEQQYTPAIGQYILDSKANGMSNAEILDNLDKLFDVQIHARTVRKWRRRAEQQQGIKSQTPQNNFYDHLNQLLSSRPYTDILIVNDLHFPFHDPQVVDLILQVASHVKPAIVERGSDEFDCPNISQFEITARERGTDYTVHMMDLSRAFSNQLAGQIGFVPFMPFKTGNHDYRFASYLQSQAPQIQDYVMQKLVADLMAADLYFMGWDWDGYEIGNSYISIHGYRSGKYVAEKFLGIYDHDVIVTGHAHRSQKHSTSPMSSLRERLVRQRFSYSTGCACQINPHYQKYASQTQHWQHGFGLARYNRENNMVIFEDIAIYNDGERKVCKVGQKWFTSSKTGWTGQ